MTTCWLGLFPRRMRVPRAAHLSPRRNRKHNPKIILFSGTVPLGGPLLPARGMWTLQLDPGSERPREGTGVMWWVSGQAHTCNITLTL